MKQSLICWVFCLFVFLEQKRKHQEKEKKEKGGNTALSPFKVSCTSFYGTFSIWFAFPLVCQDHNYNVQYVKEKMIYIILPAGYIQCLYTSKFRFKI